MRVNVCDLRGVHRKQLKESGTEACAERAVCRVPAASRHDAANTAMIVPAVECTNEGPPGHSGRFRTKPKNPSAQDLEERQCLRDNLSHSARACSGTGRM
jgi:hypothetical protein